mmetsp:Transcript_19561/g.24662  ORF Transcript_19561/g.24662 Transcript_19561/m.24662 type:complete len:349 (+) Transcript_19561:45-1091(+)
MSVAECIQFYTPSPSSPPRYNNYQEVERTAIEVEPNDLTCFECGDENEEGFFQCGEEKEQKFFGVGDRITLQGLKMDELNGRSGTITKYIAHEGRWEVKIDGYTCAVKVITEHLRYEVPIRVGDRVILRGLKTKDMNGKKGTAKKFIAGQGRWEVEMDESDWTVKIVPHKLKLEDKVQIGDRVILQNLKEGDMNGKSGRVTQYNEIEGRWEVEVDGMDIPVQVKAQKINKGELSHSEDKGDKLFTLGDTVSLQGLKTKSLNGKRGKITSFVADEGRWEVQMDRDWSVKVKPGNIKSEEEENSKENDITEQKEKDEKDKGRRKLFSFKKRSSEKRRRSGLFRRTIKANE